MIAVIDYGAGNLRSVTNALVKLGYQPKVTSKPNDVLKAAAVIFVHSYYADPDNAGVIAGITEYGISLCSVLIRDNLVATQFHPERSGDLGLRMYANFLKMAGVKR